MQMEVYNPTANQFFNEEQLGKLGRPLQTTRIKERKGFGGKLLKYLKADDVIGVANEIFGYGRWGYKVVARDHTVVEDPKKGGPIHMYTADVELNVVGCPFSFPGDGVGVVNDPYTVEMHEKARKEATSDALKRALRHYGDQFGLCLYNEDDMVEAADGTMVSVKEAKPQKAPQPKRVVDAGQPQVAPPTSQELYNIGKRISLWSNIPEFLIEVAKILGMQQVSKDFKPSIEQREKIAFHIGAVTQELLLEAEEAKAAQATV